MAHFIFADAAVLPNGASGPGVGDIWLDGLNCVGNEGSLFGCPANNIGDHNCVHSEDLSAVCTTGKIYNVVYWCDQG